MLTYITKTAFIAGSFLYSLLNQSGSIPAFLPTMHTIAQIPLPDGFERMAVPQNSFEAYLRNLSLRKDKTIYLFNKRPKANQALHYAVIDISTGDKDLQQCADAVMRLRAEYFYQRKCYDSICFSKDNHSMYQYAKLVQPGNLGTRGAFMRFMEMVFINCGTYTLQEQLKPVRNYAAMKIGDVFVKGGAPGHAEIVVDMAINKQTGERIFMLAEGYMPAQDMHILINPQHTALGPWYPLNSQQQIITASWIFTKDQLCCW